MNLQVLITTMHQKGFEKYKEMNLQTSAVIANQCNENTYKEITVDGNTVSLVSTTTRGVSRNRNIAMAHANQKCKYIMFADDDLVFVDGYEQLIMSEFEKHPYAEAIKFNLYNISEKRKIYMKRIARFERATIRNMSSSGVWGMAIKTDVIKKLNLSFNESFGPGESYYCGEDSLFIAKVIKHKVAFYRSPVEIAGIDQSDSSWFSGYNEKLFYVRGAYYSVRYKRLYPIWMLWLALRTEKLSSLSFGHKLKLMIAGKHGYKSNECFEEYEKREKTNE